MIEPAPPTFRTPDRRLVAIIVVLALLVRIWVATNLDLFRDEAYYWFWAIHPAWAYFDHSPGVAWLIAVTRAIAGDTEIGVRLFGLLTPLAILLALFRTSRLLFGTSGPGRLAILWYSFTPGALILLTIMTPDVPSTLFWTLTIWALAELFFSRNPNWWLMVGLMAGCGLLSKYTNFFLGAGILAWVLLKKPERLWLRTWQFWTGGIIACLLFLPVILANAATGFDAFAYQGSRTIGHDFSGLGFLANFAEFLAGQAFVVLPGTLVLIVIALFRRRTLAPTRTRDALDLLFLTSALPMLYFVFHALHSKVEANWLMPVWPPLMLAAAAAFLSTPATRLTRYAALSILPTGLLIGLYLITQALTQALPFPAIDRTQDLLGWRNAEVEIETFVKTSNADFLVTDNNYGLTGLLAFYARRNGHPIEVRPLGEAFRYRFLKPEELTIAGGTGLLVIEYYGKLPNPDIRAYTEFTPLGTIERKAAGKVLGHLALYLVKG